MRCRYPFVEREHAYPCGQCMPCRFNRRRIWTHRLMLEAADHDSSCFVTLTYDPGKVPENGTLRPDHLRDWLKRFRRRIEPVRVRYFACGEYGDRNGLPHYHVAVFGWPPCQLLRPRGVCPCTSCTVVGETWGFGFVFVGTLEQASAAYVCGYVTKKMTSSSDPRLRGRYPEFSRMSLKPGIGADAMWSVASEMMRYDAEVPTSLHHGKKGWPLGRYLRAKLKEMTGREKGATAEDLQRLAENLQAVRSFAWANDRAVSSVYEELSEGLEKKLSMKHKEKGL